MKIAFPVNGGLYHLIRSLLIKLNYDLFEIEQYVKKIDIKDFEYDEFHYFVMALEDRRYLCHCGVDYKSVLREVYKKVTGKKHGGASTIDMQMVRTITNYRKLTLRRKLYEMCLAVLVNFKYTKHQILACYMDNAFFGSRITGINAACLDMYGRKLNELNHEQKSILAGMLLNPKPLLPDEKWLMAVKSRAAYAQASRISVKKGNN